jgi:hypothetical protein
LRAQLAELLRSAEEGAGGEIAVLEAQLAERGAEVRRLERDLREAERVGRELVRELGARPESVVTPQPEPEAPAPEPNPEIEDLRRKLDALAALNVEREADLAAARWAVEALEARLRDLQELRGSAADLAAGLRNGARDEPNRPYPAELTPEEAQADLQRRAVLIEQLRTPRST